ncbi:isomerase [Massilia sp. Root351]|jgi:ketosteroid isomerase-like protein|uniref:nuclear transport factor 2 family protein n=1 Tax=Massilia sp. Root351 TaxID=1736522 RepID=UPI00070C7069|nr:nuclear transport factor 2 family protein [Massilia sp. Root351]KQV90385.1 isomerase [Massilia sp. Root351]
MNEALHLQLDPMRRLVRFYETLEPGTLGQVRGVYAPDAFFKDPFNEVRGHAAIIGIFEHMFKRVEEPRFLVTQFMAQDGQGFLTWEFRFGMRGAAGRQTIRGATHLEFGADGRVSMHRDYWDAAEELYEKIPLLGGFMRLLKRRARS